MTDSTLDAWLGRQSPAVEQGVRASIDFDTDTVRDAGLGEPDTGAVDCLRRFVVLDLPLPSLPYFRLAHQLLDQAGTLAFDIGITHYRTENELRMFLALAGTALFGEAAAIRRFENGFCADSPVDDVVLYFQAELEMLDGGFPGE